MTLPNELLTSKWAVQIDSEAEAQRLQEMFPDAECNYDNFCHAFNQGIRVFQMDKHLMERWFWMYTTPTSLSNGYTIYSISELKKIINP